MMGNSLKIIAAALLAMVAVQLHAKEPKAGKRKPLPTVYAFGIAASFNDSVVYYTDIQVLDSAVLGKYDLLENRSTYSRQLRDYVSESVGKPDYTCMILFNRKEKELKATYSQFLKTYEKSGSSMVPLKPEEFRFEKAVPEAF